MYILADLEWVENDAKYISFTQIALLRVNELWHITDRFYSRIRPMNESFFEWSHVGFTGGSRSEFLNAPSSGEIFDQIADWLRPDDVICWWYPDAKTWIKKLIPMIQNRQICLCESVANFLGLDIPMNAYRLGKQVGTEAPGIKHDARNDVEMMRRVLNQIRFPQPIAETIKKKEAKKKSHTLEMTYQYHEESNTLHKAGCTHVPTSGTMRGFMELTKYLGKSFRPCDCVKADLLAARRKRNQDIIARSQYNYLFTPTSNTFHRRDCKIMLSAKSILGTVLYRKCIDAGRTPCKICNPSSQDEHPVAQPASPKPVNKEISALKAGALTAEEQRAINRHRQAKEQRRAIYRNSALSADQREDLVTLSQSGNAFFASSGYQNFHLRNCKRLSGMTHIEGFSRYNDAIHAGYHPCRCCKPTEKHDATISLPNRSYERPGESAETAHNLCRKFGYQYSKSEGLSYVETPVGIWRFSPKTSPYRLDHINKIVSPDNIDNFHRQPRLFLSITDAMYYIKRHDETLAAGNQVLFKR